MGQHARETVYTNFAVGEWDRLLYQGNYYQVTHISGGYQLEQENGPLKHQFAKAELSRYISLGIVDIEPEYYTLARKNERELEFALDPADMPLDIRVRIRAVAAFLQGVKEGKWSRSKAKVTAFLEHFTETQEAILHKGNTKKKGRGGSKRIDVSDRNLIEWRQFIRIANLYEENANSSNALMKRYKGTVRGTKMAPATQEFLRTAYLNNKQASPSAVLVTLEKRNLELSLQGKPQIPEPKIRTVQRFIKSLRDLDKTAARIDAKKARLDHALSYGGPTADLPLERVEMDEKLLDLFVFLTETGLINEIHPDAIARLEALSVEVDDEDEESDTKNPKRKKKRKDADNRKRLWWSVAFDAASRSVLGMKILRTAQPTPRDAIEVLEMAVSSKAHLVEALKTNSPWPQEGKPWLVVADHGSAYDSFEFQDCVVALTGSVLSPPADHPNMRGAIERFFRTIDSKYMHMFPGQTFGNILAKGEGYDPKKLAALTDIEFAECLARLIIDCYHNTPQEGALNGRTPLQMWGYLNKMHQVRRVDEDTRWKAFAISVPNRHISNNGLVFLGLTYGDERMQELRDNSTKTTFTIRVWPKNLSKIRVKTQNGRGYITVKCNLPGTEHLTLNQWKHALLHMNKTVKKSQPRSWDTVLRTLSQVQRLVKSAEDRAGIAADSWTLEKIIALDRDVVQGVIYKRQFEHDYAQEINELLNPGDGSKNAPIESLSTPAPTLDSEFGDTDDGFKRDPNRFAAPEAGKRRETKAKVGQEAAEPPRPEPNSAPSPRRTKNRIGGPRPWEGK
ncbi:hypothetical protein [Rhizobium sp. BK376]|uniref:hypothetical protein n=1 Tax=Rhizobium sp. BK376 TaxID=2512149 RepID=UPI001042B054|nr:hypothetical protein [Rhizobium sp. BK376]TCR85314.1 hypothetical protein EV561_10785 [Rhizobium sp. BK376]